MTKAEVIAKIADKTGIEKLDVQASVEAFFSVVKSSMISGRNVYIRGFGSFLVTKRAQKTARNISKNTTIIIPEHFVPTFKPAKVFVDKIKTCGDPQKKKTVGETTTKAKKEVKQNSRIKQTV